MKSILSILMLFCFSCGNKPREDLEYKTYIICGSDTIIMDDYGNADVSKSRANHGYNDTINKIFYLEFSGSIRPVDTVYVNDTGDDRYFMYGYHYEDKKRTVYGTQFISVDKNQFPNVDEIEQIILKVSPEMIKKKNLQILSVSEFKTEKEYWSFGGKTNHKNIPHWQPSKPISTDTTLYTATYDSLGNIYFKEK